MADKTEEIEVLVKHGLFYSSIQNAMPVHQDVECRKASRVYLVKLFCEMGADPNIEAEKVDMTPLHWLAFWGDYRSVKVMMFFNNVTKLKVGCCGSRDHSNLFKRRGAFNNFYSENGQTPADIAGDLDNTECIRVIINYFLQDAQLQNIRKAFLTPSVLKRMDVRRFAQPKAATIEINGSDQIDRQDIAIAHFTSANFNKEQKSYLSLMYWAAFL